LLFGILKTHAGYRIALAAAARRLCIESNGNGTARWPVIVSALACARDWGDVKLLVAGARTLEEILRALDSGNAIINP
jgi:hypothetical protein